MRRVGLNTVNGRIFACLLALLAGACATGQAVNRPLNLPLNLPLHKPSEPCVVAFDLGSSGVRVGESLSDKQADLRFDYFGLFASTGGLQGGESQLTETLITLPAKAQLNADCKRVAGGFSVWRMAQMKDPQPLREMLERVYASTGVAVFVITQNREGRYAYQAAKAKLGSKLDTSHILDLGGGSFQVSDSAGAFGFQLGQKSSYQLLCQHLQQMRNLPGSGECSLQALSQLENAALRQHMQQYFKAQLLSPVCTAGQCPQSITAISKPITRGVYPMLGKLELSASAGVVRVNEMSRAIDKLAVLSSNDLNLKLGGSTEFNKYLISDLIFLEAITQWMKLEHIQVAEVEVNNVYGLSRDKALQSLSNHFECYLASIPVSPAPDVDELAKTCRKTKSDRNAAP